MTTTYPDKDLKLSELDNRIYAIEKKLAGKVFFVVEKKDGTKIEIEVEYMDSRPYFISGDYMTLLFGDTGVVIPQQDIIKFYTELRK